MKKSIKIITFILISILLIMSFNFNTNIVEAIDVTNRYSFTESIEEFNNPDRGIYRPTFIRCKAEGDWSNTKVQYANGLVHLRLGIKSFSKNGNGVKDYDITSQHIEKLNSYMEQIRTAGGTAIVRFAYDDFEGTKNLEPDIEQILKHIEQLEPFFKENEDIIAGVETGFLGPWGEQHSSSIVTEKNLKLIVEKLLKVVPESRTISVRRPLFYCYATGENIDEIDKSVSIKGTDAYRIGVFNDGYLGTAIDTGTFKNRKKEIAWLNNQATHTLYGGEALPSSDKDEDGFLYSSPEHIEKEMFMTHTSYLNEEWNYNLINSWKNTKYPGSDPLYSNSTAFTYIKNHLGYRFVLKEVELSKAVEQSSIADINIYLKNVGAGNVVNEKNTYIVLKNDKNEYYIPTTIDVRTWNSKQEQNLSIKIPINKDIEIGNYDVYLKITNAGDEQTTNLRTIRFANENVWNNDIGANKIGAIEIKEAKIQLGDVSLDGNISAGDLAKLKLHLIEEVNLSEESVKVADLNQDGKITAIDLAILKLKLIN